MNYKKGFPTKNELRRRLYGTYLSVSNYIHDSQQLETNFFFAQSLITPIKDQSIIQSLINSWDRRTFRVSIRLYSLIRCE